MIEPGGTGVMSDFDGNYTLSGLAPGTYTVIGRFIAYNSKEEQVTITGNENFNFRFTFHFSDRNSISSING